MQNLKSVSILNPLKPVIAMKKFLFALFAVVSLVLVQCGEDNDYLISKGRLGDIQKDTDFAALDRIFANDSVEKFTGGSDRIQEYRVFDPAGQALLVFVPLVENDSIKGIELVKIFSSAYKTDKGISTASNFKDVADNYTIDKIEPSFSAAILFVNEINATISLDKQDLNLGEFDMSAIRQDQIPDLAHIKYITLWFD